MPARVNLRELMGRPQRFEHHLVVVGRAGGAQLECATASEPLYFAHLNGSDEYALALPTGDRLLDSFQGRTFLSDPATGDDVGRYKHGVRDLVLHPHGWLHWPGRLRPPYETFHYAPGMRRRGISIVACACAPCAPTRRPLGVTPGREADRKGDVPMLLCDTRSAAPGVVGAVAGAVLELVEGEAAPARGGYVVDLDSADLIHLGPGERAACGRALLFHAPDEDAEPPPPSWREEQPPPFPPFEDQAPGALPVTLGALGFTAGAADTVIARLGKTSAEVPRYWLARHLYRVALHGLRLGYTETYGGFFVDDRAGLTLGIRGAGAGVRVEGDPYEALARVYRAVAPPGYAERPSQA